MTPQEFERLRAQCTVTQTNFYEAIYSTRYLELPVEPKPFQEALRTAQNASQAAWRAMDVAMEKYRRALTANAATELERDAATEGGGH